ncbi:MULTISPECIES: hypothetical protein [Corynebacterium]|uniref:hypothetical protein n=1 Tax=Corynebacterium TaxID=1716 RepID=UPI00114D0848|nr:MULTISPECIES: hypothetical protein [Corynebacterium]
MASRRRHLSEGVFRSENAFCGVQMAFLLPKTPFGRCRLQDAMWRKLFRSQHAADNLAPPTFTRTSLLLSRPTFNDVVSSYKVLLKRFGSEGSLGGKQTFWRPLDGSFGGKETL